MSACDIDPCQNDGTCAVDDSAEGYSCTCSAGYFGVNCTVSKFSKHIINLTFDRCLIEFYD